MSPLRIYGDSHGFLSSRRSPDLSIIPLNRFGTLCDLACAGVVLSEGMKLILSDSSCDEEDLEYDATVYFDDSRNVWVGELADRTPRYVPRVSTKPVLECYRCHRNLEKEFLAAHSVKILCPACGARADTPILPPGERADR